LPGYYYFDTPALGRRHQSFGRVKAHEGNLIGHFRFVKALDVLHEHFYSPMIKRDMPKIYGRCITCKQVKSKVLPHGLCTFLPVSKEPSVDIFMNFILGLPRSKRVVIPFLLLYIGFLRLYTLYLVIKLMMQLT
jgi:hypothetical protein